MSEVKMDDAEVIKLVSDALGDSRIKDIDDSTEDWSDIAAMVKHDFETIDFEKKVKALQKITSMVIEMYMNNSEVFIPEFNRLISHVKLNAKIKEKYKLKEERAQVYRAIRSFDFHSKKMSFDQSYKKASKEFKVPEKYLRSIIGSRNNLKRNSVKI